MDRRERGHEQSMVVRKAMSEALTETKTALADALAKLAAAKGALRDLLDNAPIIAPAPSSPAKQVMRDSA